MTTPAMTKTDLLLLGMLLDRPVHGYELYQQIQTEGIDGWFNISAAGVYYSLRKLRDQGLVVEARQRASGSSRKSTYRLTEKGRAGFFDTMDAELAARDEIYLDFDLAIYLLNKYPLVRALSHLEQRLAFLAEECQAMQSAVTAERNNGSSPLKLAILDHKCRYLEMEQQWLAEVMQSIQENGDASGAGAERRRGLMVLSGELRHYHLPDLMRLIVSGQHSGTLKVTDGAELRTLSFEKGQPVYASYVNAGAPRQAPADCDQVLEGLCDLFRWQQGRFTFDQQTAPEVQSVPLDCSAEELMLRGCRQVDNWAIIQNLVSSGDAIFELGSASDNLDRLSLLPGEERVVDAVDGVKDVAAIARELDLTLFETSRIFYCLAAIGVLRTADPDKIRLRRVFRELAELMCESTLPWRASPDDRSCEEEVNHRVKDLPLCLDRGRIVDQADPQLGTEELKQMYLRFLTEQFRVIGWRFGQGNTREAFQRTLRQLAPELQAVARRYGFDRLTVD